MKGWLYRSNRSLPTHSDNHHDASPRCQRDVRGYQAKPGSEGNRVVDAYRTRAIEPVTLGKVCFGIFPIPSGRRRRNFESCFGEDARRIYYVPWDVETGSLRAEMRHPTRSSTAGISCLYGKTALRPGRSGPRLNKPIAATRPSRIAPLRSSGSSAHPSDPVTNARSI